MSVTLKSLHHQLDDLQLPVEIRLNRGKMLEGHSSGPLVRVVYRAVSMAGITDG